MTHQTIEESTAKPAQSISPAKLAHVVLRTKQYEPMVQWYKTVLQAHATYEVPGTMAFLTYDDEHHRVAVLAVPVLADRPPMANGLEHIAFTYAELGDLIHTYERLKGAGIEPYWTINHGPTMSFYYRDPDNNQLELQVDNMETIEEVNAFLDAEYPTNPIGVEFDPDDLARRFHEGVPESELRARPNIGKRGMEGVPTI
jgi:catechol-2,3-dioxygenase